ncbi:MAG: hypothetical protein P8R37_02955 [Opitutae bacterium]|nr:hypothetical protein [Opitutae bacterium]MDG1300527.1 hypothetical protein [Opitutae bacterium]
MKDNNDISEVTLVTVFLAYDKAENARRIKLIFDHACKEIGDQLIFDFRLWRLDILQFKECWGQALVDLTDANLFSMSFNRESASKFSMQLTALAEKWFSYEDETKSILLVSPEGACGRSEFAKVLQGLGQRCDLGFSSSSGYSDHVHEYLLHSTSPSINPNSNLLN